MGKTILKDSMAAEIEALCQQEKREAERLANQILAEAEHTAEERRLTALKKVEREEAARMAEATEHAAWEAARFLETFQHGVIEEILSRLRGELEALTKRADFENTVVALLTETLAAFPECAVVYTAPQYAACCRSWLSSKGRPDISVEEDPDLWDGVAAMDPTHTVRVRNTLRGRLRRMEPELRKLCRERLFGM